MRVGFLGDVAVPVGLAFPRADWGEAVPTHTVINLEGPIVVDERVDSIGRREPRVKLNLYNRRSVIGELVDAGVTAVTIANNHIFDNGIPLSDTREGMKRAGIHLTGAGSNLKEACTPAIIRSGAKEIVLLAFGWGGIGCSYASRRHQGVAPLRRSTVLRVIEEVRGDHPEATVVILPHWGFTIEKYPLPAHRQLAHDAVDIGADLIIGHHPHCLQGAEVYNGVPILYSIGNWFLPHGTHFGRRIAFPEVANEQLAFNWDSNGNHTLHYHRYCPATHAVEPVHVEDFGDRSTLREISPFEDMSGREYDEWFRENRTNPGFLLPYFKSHDPEYITSFKEAWLYIRHKLLLGVVGIGLGSLARNTIGRSKRYGRKSTRIDDNK